MRRVLCALSVWTLAACAAGIDSEEREAAMLAVGDTRTVQLQALRFDVTNFEKRLTRDDLLRLPRDVRERLWLLDLDLSNGPNSPRLLDNALSAIRALDPAGLAPAERNMQALLRMTPDTANLKGTSMETLIDLAPLLGVAPEQVLADLFKRNVEDPFLDDSAIAEAIISQVIATHPNAQSRLGARTADNPEGIYPVSPGALPVTLTDLATNFETFGKRFGPYQADGKSHPGFIGETTAAVLTEDFAISVRANANALPYRGLDLSNASPASVSSIRSQIDGLFDFEDPSWLRVEGLVPGEPSIQSLTFRIFEEPSFVKGGLSPNPSGLGASPAWQLSPWRFERMLIGAAQHAFAALESNVAYAPRGQSDPLFSARVAQGFQTISVRGGLGSPPQSSYVWDLLLEVAQVRLHDGGLAEGDANLEFTLRNVRLGTTTSELESKVKANLRAAPSSLLQLTETVLASTQGEADFYYYRAREENVEATRGDWLLFIVPGDIPAGEDDKPARAYDYAHPGFYADAGLTQKLSQKRALDGDEEHEKVRLADHAELYVEDAAGSVYHLRPAPKPSQNRVSLSIERVR
jgi:hypothetical protein